jgi:osomolarity two-component system, sensor histidine kinase SLN1
MSQSEEAEQLPPPATSVRTASVVKKTTFDTGVRVHWARFKKRIGNGSAPSESLLEGETTTESSSRRWGPGPFPTSAHYSNAPDDDEEVDEIVVDSNILMEGAKSVTQGSEPGISAEKSGNGSATHGTHATDRDSFNQDTGGWLDRSAFLSAIRYRFWPIVHQFFFTKFYEPSVETHYQKEAYYQTKSLRMWGGMFIILNWVLVCILIPRGWYSIPFS